MDVACLVFGDANEVVAQVVDDERGDGTDVALQAADQLAADRAGVPQADQCVEAARHDHGLALRVVEGGDAALDAVVGVVLVGLEGHDVADEQSAAVIAVLAA